MIKVKVTMKGVPTAAIRDVVERLSRPNALAERVGDYAVAAMKSYIDESHTPEGSPYPPLTARYREWKVRHGYPPTPLKRTLIMYDSITHDTPRPSSAGITMLVGPDEAQAPYARYADARRRFIGVGPTALAMIEMMAADEVAIALRGVVA